MIQNMPQGSPQEDKSGGRTFPIKCLSELEQNSSSMAVFEDDETKLRV